MVQKIKVINSDRAITEMANIAYYITNQGYPETAKKYYNRLLEFGNTLGLLPDKFAICRKSAFKRWKYRCAVFEDTCIFVYKIKNDEVIILRVIHGKLIK
ncbi:MAG: type II toxin-antitoxin system RelE/ParE family toxin [Bacteroidota bacterium]|nr:type II toxin-antitoxin system RelE/ParE family toxin [Bacteroidota bacterium]